MHVVQHEECSFVTPYASTVAVSGTPQTTTFQAKARAQIFGNNFTSDEI